MSTSRWTWQYLALSGVVLVVAGLVACAIALTVKLLPHDVRYLGMTAPELCRLHGCRIVHFMVHDRLSFGGSLIATGIVYIWLAARPLACGKFWAFFTLAGSGALGFASFLAYLGFGYLDVWHQRATLALLCLFVLGLVLAFGELEWARLSMADLRQANPWPSDRRASLGRALLLFTSAGMILGGVTILVLGMTRVFVPQDLEFMRLGRAELAAVNVRLVPLIAHDRAGFGGGLASGGFAIFMTVWRGARPAEPELWWVLAIAGVIGFGAAIGAHPVVGYLSFSHLLPAVVGAITFLVGIGLLAAPMHARVEPAPPVHARASTSGRPSSPEPTDRK